MVERAVVVRNAVWLHIALYLAHFFVRYLGTADDVIFQDHIFQLLSKLNISTII